MDVINPEGRLPVAVGVNIVNGLGRPPREEEDLMQPGFNVITPRHHLYTPYGALVPRDWYGCEVATYAKTLPGDYGSSCQHLSKIDPREFARRSPGALHLTDPLTDILSAPLYRKPYETLLLENKAVARKLHGDPNWPWNRGRDVRVGLLTSVSMYYKQPSLGEVAVWTVADIEELACRAVERQLRRPILCRFGSIETPDWKAPEMLLDIAFYTNASGIGHAHRSDFLTEHGWQVKWSLIDEGNQKFARQALDEFVVDLIKDRRFPYDSDQEKDLLAKKLLRTMFKGGHYDNADLAYHHPSKMNVLMDPWEFDPRRRNTQLQGYFRDVFKTVPLRKSLQVHHEKLVRFALTQLQQGVTHHGVRGTDIGYTSEAEFASKWEAELHPLQTIVILCLFLELLTKQMPWKNLYQNQKPPRGNKDDQPDETWTASSRSVLEFEATSPNNVLFPMDVMKGTAAARTL
ncbi:hypothetical protein HDU93_003552 [Gonapodya sp. JEL0774]|nr:hypothetical protein HDU93_003552 [Gonapodya sp. JEL0774]